ncbi:MAG: hypothetical protein AAGE52_18130 [Myxococcota bacterium]
MPSENEEPENEEPENEQLLRAQDAFARGDYAEVRRLTDALTEHEDPEIARLALALRRRTQVDPAQIGVLVLCLLFFGWVTWKYVLS